MVGRLDDNGHCRYLLAVDHTALDGSDLRLVDAVRISIRIRLLLLVQLLDGDFHVLIRDRDGLAGRGITHLLVLENVPDAFLGVAPVGGLEPVRIVVLGFTVAVEHLVSVGDVDRDGVRLLGFVLLRIVLRLVIARHGQLHRRRLAKRGTEHEEGDEQHQHIHHRREVHAHGHLLLLTFLFLCHYLAPPLAAWAAFLASNCVIM